MSIKLTDTQIVMLSAAAQRDDRCLVAPPNLKGGATQKVATKLIGAGLAKEIKAKPGAPVWRRDEQAGQSYALKLTAAGARAIADRPPAWRWTKRAKAQTRACRSLQPALRSLRPLPTFLQPPQACPRPEAARSWRGSSNCFSAIVAQR